MCKKDGDLVTRRIDFIVISDVHQYFQGFSSWACGRVAASCPPCRCGPGTFFDPAKHEWKHFSEEGLKS